MKGQAAMEYLMTYGWALLVIVIVIAILLVLVPMTAPEQCIFEQPGLACNQPTNPVMDTNGSLYGKLTNGFSKSIKVKAIFCTADRASKNFVDGEEVTEAGKQLIPPQGYLKFENATATGGITCYKLGQAKDADVTFTVGEDFSGIIWVWYNYVDEPDTYPKRIAKANIVTKAVQAQ